MVTSGLIQKAILFIYKGKIMRTHGCNHEDANGSLGAFLGAGSGFGREFRACLLILKDGTNANTIKGSLFSRYNGDVIAETDNIAKGATTGDWTLDANGEILTIETSGLTGDAIYAFGSVILNPSGSAFDVYFSASTNDILLSVRNAGSAALLDLTSMVNAGWFYFEFIYITKP